MLYEYVERKRKENLGAQLHVTYLVTGKHIQNGYAFHKVAVVKEEQLETTKARLAVTASVHVYSIQKAVLKDSGPLFNTDYDIIKTNLQNCNKFSAIQCPAAVLRSLPSGSHLQQTSQASGDQPAVGMLATNGHGPPLPAKATSQQPKGIMGMFTGKTASKSQDTQKESKAEGHEVTAAASSKPSGKANAVNNFFGKASINKLKAISEAEQVVKEVKPAAPPSALMAEVKLSSREVPEKPAKKQEPARVQQKDKKGKLKRGEVSDGDDEKEVESLTRKRRRIKQPLGDSSEEEGTPADRDMKALSTNPEVAQKAEPEPQHLVMQTGEKKRRRKRVLKTRTFLDEEGSIVTEKVYESGSCTDSGEEFAMSRVVPTQKPVPAAASKQETKAMKKGAGNKGTKQASIMGFFQKK
ncbi:DNA polymerase delta subunit 3 isoform X2 [Rhinatrema bivittatum]|nr:DNA polymerase delta subunit 3 isoform X2 [Rhinatrema bivittatum]